MISKTIKSFIDNDFITVDDDNDKTVYKLHTPCSFIIEENIVQILKEKYVASEEIGGLLYAQPSKNNGGIIYTVSKVSFIRNAIEDNPREDGRTKADAYLPDRNEFKIKYQDCINCGCLPIRFHTHPVYGNSHLDGVIRRIRNLETSHQDQLVSDSLEPITDVDLILPNCLIVGSDLSSEGLFIGLYNGMVAPKEFKEVKEEVIHQNISRVGDTLFENKVTGHEKYLLIVGGLVLLGLAIKYRKYSIPILLLLPVLLTGLLTNTKEIEAPKYFNQINNGKAVIYLP